MKIDQKFDVTFSVNKYPKLDRSINYEGTLQDKVEKVDIVLYLDEKTAGNFLFRFTMPTFKIDDYSVGISFDEYHRLKNIVLTKDDSIYVVTNKKKVISEIHEGYFRLIAMSKLNSILEFDFNIEEDDEIHEEFEEEIEEES